MPRMIVTRKSSPARRVVSMVTSSGERITTNRTVANDLRASLKARRRAQGVK